MRVVYGNRVVSKGNSSMFFVVIVIAFAIGVIVSTMWFRKQKYGCGFVAALLLPFLLVICVAVLIFIYRMISWGYGINEK